MIRLNSGDMDRFKGFIPLQDKTLNKIAELGIKRTVSKGDMVFGEKDSVNTVYFVLKGKVSMFRLGEEGQKRVIYILNAGEFINEVIFDGVAASISCEAFEDCELVYFYKNDLLQIMAADFEFNKIIINSMGHKIRRLYRQMKNTIPIKMDKKVAAKLWKLSKDYGVETEEGTLIDIDISITYLSSMLGSTRETISKIMTRFEKEGIIKYKNRKIVVPDRNQLSLYFRGIDE